jgi:hypothetical protein
VVIATAKASYFSGGALSDSEVNWKISQKITEFVLNIHTHSHKAELIDIIFSSLLFHHSRYRPPGWPTFTFGTFKPWWSLPIVFSSSDISTQFLASPPSVLVGM